MRNKLICSRIDGGFSQDCLNKIAILGALCIFLSTIEYMFPKPLPFLRLGLANLPILLALSILDFKSYLLLVLVKLLGQALINGTLASYVFLFSACGSLAGALMMRFIYHYFKKNISYIGLSIFGALAANLVQILLSVNIVFGDAAWRIFPIFIGFGLVSGFFIGFFAEQFSSRSFWWQSLTGNHDSTLGEDNIKGYKTEAQKNKLAKKKPIIKKNLISENVIPTIRFAVGIIIIPACLFEDDLKKKIIVFGFFIIINILSGKRLRIIYLLVLIFSITAFNSFTPLGKILFELGSYRLTLGALEAGLVKAFTLSSLILISQFSVSKSLKLPGRLGGLLAKSFYFLEKLLAMRIKISQGNILASMDEILISIFPPEKIGSLFDVPTSEEKSYKGLSSLFYFLLIVTPVWFIFLI